MIFKTYNTTYTLKDMGDGAFLISGHIEYCPVPTMVRIYHPLTVGNPVLFEYVDRPHGVESNHVITTPVQEIIE